MPSLTSTSGTPLLPIIDPHLPDDLQKQFFMDRAAVVSHDPRHRKVIRKATATYGVAVEAGRSRFLNHEAARTAAAQIKRDAVEHLDRYLEQFETAALANGMKVHWAQTGEEAARIIVDIAKAANVSHVVKSKSMASEEIHLNEALEKANIEPIETDLGEYICQLRNEPPYHIVTPVMHLTKADIADTFEEKHHLPRTEVAEELALQAREILRDKFVTAVMGITGGNFLVADVGMIAITENEGNARLSFSLPDVHVALVGIEKIIPRLEDLALFWPLLATSGTGQHITCYNSLIGGPRKAGEIDGLRACHIVLMDNGRTKLLADPEAREAAMCIRCGACLNACPIFKSVGGHSYGTTYQGPIGAVITPHLKSLDDWKHLPYASSLCGRCAEVCPVRIDVHHHLLRNRRNAAQRGLNGWRENSTFKLWLWGMKSKTRFRILGRLSRWSLKVFDALGMQRRTLGNPVRGRTRTRALPKLADQSFHDWWASERDKKATLP